MNLFAFTSKYPVKAATELREAKCAAFCLLIMDRRKVSRNVRKTTKSEVVLAPGMAGYVFAIDPDPWKVSKIPGLHPVRRSDGRWQRVTASETAWLIRPPSGLFHDTDKHKHIRREASPDVKAGDTVAFTLACEQIKAEVLSTDGHTLTLRLRMAMLGKDTVRVPLCDVEIAA